MTFELGTFHVSSFELVDGRSPSTYRDGALIINRAALLEEFHADARLAAVQVDVARPGESVRILTVHDIIEPRTKVAGPGQVFPGSRSAHSSLSEAVARIVSQVSAS